MTTRPRIYAEHEPKPPAREFRARYRSASDRQFGGASPDLGRLDRATKSSRFYREQCDLEDKLDELLGDVDDTSLEWLAEREP
jgi:hypothetical protein